MTKKTERAAQGLHEKSYETKMGTKDYPAVVRYYDKVSLSGQFWYLRFIQAELILAVCAALASDLIREISPRALGLMGLLLAALLATGLGVQLFRLVKREDQSWFEGRAVAESAKTLTWRLMMKVQPFHEEANLDENFVNRLRAVLHGCLVCQPNMAITPQEITQRMRDTRNYNWEKRRDFYVASRLSDQIRWYHGKAKYNERQSRLWLMLSIGAQIVAIGAAFVVLYNKHHWNFVPLLTTMAASCVAWSQAKNFDELSESYRMANFELCEIRDEKILAAATEAEFLDAVVNSEGAISREHTMWAARSGSPVVWKIA